jgi:FkbH-like protein
MTEAAGGSDIDDIARLLRAGDGHRRAGDLDAALESYDAAADRTEVPTAATAVRRARVYADAKDVDAARAHALQVVDAGDDFASWDAAAQLLDRIGWPDSEPKRTARLAVLGSATTTYFTRSLRLVCARRGIATTVYEAGFGLYRQELLDPSSGLHSFAPEVVVLAVDATAVAFPDLAEDPVALVDGEVGRWEQLWAHVDSTFVQHNFVVPSDAALAHLDAQLAGARTRTLHALNDGLAGALPPNGRIVDCDRLAARVGHDRWHDPLWWDRAQLAVSLPATPVLATHTAAVIAGRLGLGRKCLVLDLDNTLWGGVIGEDGLDGLALGGDATGEAFLRFQERVRALRRRGVILAAVSKNDDHVAREPFERHPSMKLGLDDFAAFLANWNSKVENIQHVADDLGIGLDALAYVDDNPAERQEVRRFLPDVDVLMLPAQPSLFARTLADYPWFETGTFTAEDAARTDQYRARAEVRALERSATSIDDFYRDLRMAAVVQPFDDADLPRVAQLLGKTNQFNLTTRRHDLGTLQQFADDVGTVHLTLRLRDRFTDHGLVGVAIARVEGDVLDIDTLLMSCRVIGRTVEHALVGELARAGIEHGCSALRGTYVPTAKNGLVRDLYATLGFELERDDGGTTTWRRVIDDSALGGSAFIEMAGEADRGAA